MINESTIQAYLATCKPEAARVARTETTNPSYTQDTTRYFPMSESDKRITDLMNTIAVHIEWATDNKAENEVEETCEADPVFDALTLKWELEQAEEDAEDARYDAMAKAHYVDVDETVPARMTKISENSLTWCKEQVSFTNPWDVMENTIDQIWPTPQAGMAFTFLLEDMRNFPEELQHAGVILRNKVRSLLAEYSDRVILKEETKGVRPAEIYRAFHQPLEYLFEQYRTVVGPTLRALMEAQSLPYSELESPSWLDAYTGDAEEKEPAAHYQGALMYPYPAFPAGNHDVVTNEDGSKSVIEIAMPSMVKGANRSSESYNREDELDDDIEFDDRRDGIDPMAKDWTWSNEVNKSSSVFDIMHFHPADTIADGVVAYKTKVVSATIWKNGKIARIIPLRAPSIADDMKEIRARLSDIWKNSGFSWDMTKEEKEAEVFAQIKRTYPFKRVFNRLQELGRSNCHPVDLIYIIKPLWNESCFPDRMWKHIRLVPQKAGCSTMAEFLNMFFDEVMEALNDANPSHNDTPVSVLSHFCESSIKGYVKAGTYTRKRFQDKVKPGEVTKTEEYNEAVFNAALESKELSVVDDKGRVRNLPSEAGWRAWRTKKSIAGNDAFELAFNNGASMKDAMKAFFEVAKTDRAPTIRQDVVVKLHPEGVTLSSGRKIAWNIAILKQKGRELSWPDKLNERIKAAIIKSNLGGLANEFASLL